MRKLWALVAWALVVGMLAGCKNTGVAQNSTQMRVVNAVVDAESLDVLVDDDVKLAAVAPGTTTTYASFDAGTRGVKLRSATNQAILLDKSVSFASEVRTTLLVYGKRAAITTTLLLEDTTAPASGKARVRVIGLAPDAGSVDLYLTATDLASAGPAVIATAGYAATTTSVDTTAGSFKIVLTAAGTQEILFQSAAQNLAAGSMYSIVIFPSLGGRLVNAVLLEQGANGPGTLLANPLARVKAVNAVGDSLALNYKSDGSTLLASVPFTGTSSYVTTASGSHALQVEASNVPGTNIASATKALDAARDYSVVASGPVASPALTVLADDNSIPAAGYARIRFVNARSDGGATDVLFDFASQASGVAALSASGYASIAAGTSYTITFASPGGVSVIASLTGVELDAGNVYTAYVFGTAAAAQARLVRDR